jgi:hypothetical protein
MAVTVRVENLPQIEARLEELGTVKVPTAMRKIVVAGAKPMKAAIKSAGQSMFAGQSKTLPGGLVTGVRYKASRKRSGQQGYTIGPFGKGTAHRHLVIGGHEIVGHKPNLTHTGKRTRPVPFVERGREVAQAPALAAIAEAAKVALEAAAKL